MYVLVSPFGGGKGEDCVAASGGEADNLNHVKFLRFHYLCPNMKIYSTLNIGSFHTNYCEDFLVSEPVGAGKQLIAVMDGCTMGEESAFASMLMGKILRNISKSLFYQDFIKQSEIDLDAQLKEILRQLFAELKFTKNKLGLETNELLSTMIIGLIDPVSSKAELFIVGDGLIYHDGKVIEYEQDDKPDYLGYHLHEDFNAWHENHDQKLSIKAFNDLSICTDGIYTFRNFENPRQQKNESEIMEFLLKDIETNAPDNFLERKMLSTKEDWKHVVTDDLAIVRIVK